MSYQLFISLRFAEAINEATALKTALEAKGISTFLCAVEPGGDICTEIVNALHDCQLAIIMGTKTYGKNTRAGYSTFEELRFIIDELKPFFLVKMCGKFEERETRFRLGSSVSYFLWTPGHPIPADLVTKIVEKLSSVTNGSSIDSALIEELSSWFGQLKIPFALSRKYAQIVVANNIGSIAKLQRKIERNSNYLEEIGGFDEDDIIDIKEGLLKLSSSEEETVKREGTTTSSAVTSPVEVKLPESANTKITVFRSTEKSIPEPIVSRTHPHPPISFEAHSKTVYSLSWDSVGNKIASGSNDNHIKIWDGNSLELLRTLEGHSNTVRSLDWNHDGKKLVSGSEDKTIKLWDGLSGQLLKTLTGHSHWVWSVAWSHDDSRIVSGSWDHTIKIWDGISGETIKTMKGHSSPVYTVQWNHDDSRIVSGSGDYTIKIWDSSSGTIIRTLTGHSDSVWSVSYSHDGSRIVSGSHDKTVRIWNAETGDLMKVLEGHSERVWCVAWSRDDRKIASCSPDDMKLILWDSLTGQSLTTFPLVSGACALAWSPDNNEIVCGDGINIIIFSVPE
jgi:WD40 repeat protein